MTETHGHRSRNAWQVALWIGNDEDLYREAVRCRRAAKSIDGAVRHFFRSTGLQGCRYPDGAVFNFRCVRDAIAGIE